MIELIQFLVENPDVVTLVEENQASLMNVSGAEQQAIIEAFKIGRGWPPYDLGWR